MKKTSLQSYLRVSKTTKQILDDILFYWIIDRSESGISVSNLLYELPIEVRKWWPIKDSTLRSHIANKCKTMNREGLLVHSQETTSQGYSRYIYSRVEGNQRLIPDWFKDKVLKYLKPKKKVKINCKNCVFRKECLIRQIYTQHNKKLSLTPKIKDDLKKMCQGVRQTTPQYVNDQAKRGLLK